MRPRLLMDWRATGVLFRVCGLLAAISLTGGWMSRQDPPSEYQVKAVFLYNFAKFVEWPADAFPSADAAIVIGVLGADPFGSILDHTTQGERVNGREIQIRRLAARDNPRGCHVLFISASERRRLREILDALGPASVLTVGESDDFADTGGIILLSKEQHRVRLTINVAAADRAGLRISSKLLSLARLVDHPFSALTPAP